MLLSILLLPTNQWLIPVLLLMALFLLLMFGHFLEEIGSSIFKKRKKKIFKRFLVSEKKQEESLSSQAVVAALLKNLLKNCEQKQVCLISDVKFEQTIPLTDVELTILLGNLLDNAFEGTIDSIFPFLKLSIKTEKNELLIVVENICLRDHPRVPKNKEYHGIGQETIAEIVTNYQGSFEMKTTKSSYLTSIRLPIDFGKES